VSQGVNGEFTFSLKEKVDRFGKIYLFASIKMLDSVLFVRPTGQSGPDGSPIWFAQLRPYTGQQEGQQEEPDDAAVWRDNASGPLQRRQKP
jgi:hypothetical protein